MEIHGIKTPFRKRYMIVYCKKSGFCSVSSKLRKSHGSRPRETAWREWEPAKRFRLKWNAEHYAYELRDKYKKFEFFVIDFEEIKLR